jgi:hypothetical protein
MESRIDYLKLQTGASFTIPFEELIIFATNLDPEDLMDPAFLRRLPYKIEVASPGLEQYRVIFDNIAALHGMTLTDDTFKYIVYMIKQEKGLDLAGFQPIFIIDQVEATCRFLGIKPELKSPYIDFAINNLRVKRNNDPRANANMQIPAPKTAAKTGRETAAGVAPEY